VGLEVVLVLLAAFGAGVIDAMAGGGGLIQVPALFAAYPAAPHTQLLGTGKLAGLAGASSAALRYLRHVRLDHRLVGVAAASAFACALLGAGLSTLVPPAKFRALVPLLLTLVLAYTLLHKDFGDRHRPSARGRRDLALVGAGAGVIGLYDGFFGPGTGSFLIFLFIRGFGLDFLHASASAKLVNAAANLAAVILFGLTGNVIWLLGLGMAACNALGAQLGSHVAIRRGNRLVRAVFLLVVGSLIAKTAADALRLWATG
jgi:uncharacterized membrane protein YfcA